MFLEDWQRRLDAAAGQVELKGDTDYIAVFLALRETLRVLPDDSRTQAHALLGDLPAFRQDVITNRYETWADVLDYCRRSANPVGRLVLLVNGYRDEAAALLSDAVCSALQLTNFWQGSAIGPRDGYTCRSRSSRPITLSSTPSTGTMDCRVAQGHGRCRRTHRGTLCKGPARCRPRARPAGVGTADHLAWRPSDSRPSGRGRLRCLFLRASLTRRDGCRSPQEQYRPRAGQLTRKTSFYYSFLVLPSAERRAITAVFDVCRAIDDAVDLETDPARAAKALEVESRGGARV